MGDWTSTRRRPEEVAAFFVMTLADVDFLWLPLLLPLLLFAVPLLLPLLSFTVPAPLVVLLLSAGWRLVRCGFPGTKPPVVARKRGWLLWFGDLVTRATGDDICQLRMHQQQVSPFQQKIAIGACHVL